MIATGLGRVLAISKDPINRDLRRRRNRAMILQILLFY
jgi:hypothetical protein